MEADQDYETLRFDGKVFKKPETPEIKSKKNLRMHELSDSIRDFRAKMLEEFEVIHTRIDKIAGQLASLSEQVQLVPTMVDSSITDVWQQAIKTNTNEEVRLLNQVLNELRDIRTSSYNL
jgi:hypothetical protein